MLRGRQEDVRYTEAIDIMGNWIIRYLRLHCAFPGAKPVAGKDGVVAVAAINESAGLARLLLVDMRERNSGASVTNAVEPLAREAHRLLVARFGIQLSETQITELDSAGNFDWVVPSEGGALLHQALQPPSRRLAPRSREAYLAWSGDVGRAMLSRADAISAGEWAGVEG